MKTNILVAAMTLALSGAAFAAGARDHAAASTTMTTRANTQQAHTTQTTTTASTVRGPSRTGQPMASCGSATAPNTPGNSASAPGSAFNPDGNAGTKYAGEQPQNSRNTASVSQYDAACLHQK